MDYIYYALPTYKSFEHARTSVESLFKGSRIPDKIIIVDNSGDGTGSLALNDLTESHQSVVSIWPQTYNLGCARAWNMIMRTLANDYVIIGNDDVFVHEHTIKSMIETVQIFDNQPFVFGNGASGNAFSLFMMRQWAFNEIGAFDEKFYPAYLEDNDMWRRTYQVAKRKFTPIFAPEATYDHIGSSTLKKYDQPRMEEHHHAFKRNQRYYSTKWGGAVGYERYTYPFDNEL